MPISPHVADAASAASAFSPIVLRALTRATMPGDAVRRIAGVARTVQDRHDATLGEAFDSTHALLSKRYRNEYIFKNDVVSRVVFGRHSPRTASALPEFPMGASFADLLIVNGTTTVYEIKTDLDRFDRLDSQLNDYASRAEHVFVVVSEERAELASTKVPASAGVLALNRRGSLRKVRTAPSNLDALVSANLFDMLRAPEAFEVLRRLEGWQAPGDQAEAWRSARRRFAELPVRVVHHEAVRQLHARAASVRHAFSLGGIPASLRGLAYGEHYSGVGASRLTERLRAPARQFI